MAGRRAEIALTEDEQRQFLEDGWTLQVASVGPKGFPHLVAMWYVIVDGDIHFTTFRKSQKIVNLKRDPKMTVMLESGKKYNELKGLVIEGEGEIIDDLETTARIMSLVGAKYQGMPIPTETLQAVSPMASKRVTVRLRPTDVYSWDHVKLGGRY